MNGAKCAKGATAAVAAALVVVWPLWELAPLSRLPAGERASFVVESAAAVPTKIDSRIEQGINGV
jgi:hypothetical protein